MSLFWATKEDLDAYALWRDNEERMQNYVKEQLQEVLDQGWSVSSISFSVDGDVLAVICYPSLSDRYFAPSIFVKLSRSVFNLEL